MRTTIVLDDSLEEKLRGLASKKGLSDFVNQCLMEHFAREERTRRMAALEKSYQRAAKKNKAADEFDLTSIEDWPEW